MPSPADSSQRPFWARLAIAFCLTHAVGVLGFFVLRALLPRWPPPLALVNSFVPFLFAPLVLTLPLALLARSRVAFIAGLALLGLFVIAYGTFFLPRLQPAVASADGSLKVMTFNLQYDHPQPEQVIAVIESENADVVAVQELTDSTAELLRQRLSALYPHLMLDPEMSTTGLLSRYPFLDSQWFRMAKGGYPAPHVAVEVNGRPIHVLAVHPPPPRPSWLVRRQVPSGIWEDERDRQIAGVAQRVAALEGTVVVLGDLNATDQSRSYVQMAALLKDAYREAGWGFGFTFPHGARIGQLPLPGPLVRIDYVFHSDDLYAEDARVRCEGGSNHCYLVVKLGLVSPERP